MADDFYDRNVQTQIAKRVLTILVPVCAIAAVVATLAVFLISPERWVRSTLPSVAIVIFLGLVLLVVRKGYVRRGATLFVIILAIGIVSGMILNGGVSAPLYLSSLSVCGLVSWLYPARRAVVFGAATIAVGGLFVWLAEGGYIRDIPPLDPMLHWILISVCLGLLMIVSIIPNRMLHQSLLAGDEKTKSLTESEARLKTFLSAVEASSDAIGMSTPDGKHWYQNKAFDELFGNVGDDPPKTIYVDEAVGREVFQTIMDGEPWMGEVKMQGPKKPVRDIFLRAYAVKNASGNITTLVGVHMDITEKLRLEEMMIQSEKMLSVGGLAAGMAHEINNPLAGMMQNAEVISNRLDGDRESNKKAALKAGTDMTSIRKFMKLRDIPHMLDMIRASGTNAAGIVTNMLSFARKSDTSFVHCGLADLLNQTIDLAGSDYDIGKNYDFRSIDIIREFQSDMPQISCEPGKIQQVVFNILRNGAEAMLEDAGEQGNNKKSQFVLRLKHETETDMARIEISDNGPGMDSDTCKRVFEPFFTTKDVDSGMGLGLSVSYFIIKENHHGELSVESTPGKGSTFIIRLPLTDKRSEKTT
jgi:signal transduction histidine kinase